MLTQKYSGCIKQKQTNKQMFISYMDSIVVKITFICIDFNPKLLMRCPGVITPGL